MTQDLGTVRPGETIYVEFDTFGPNGNSITMTGLAVTDIEVYKNGSVTQRASDAGYALLDTDGIDFDALTGIHGFSIDLADNTTAGFWSAGARYRVVISSITVDGQTISFTAARFRIGYAGALLDTTIATLAGQTSFTLTAGSADNSAYVGWLAVVHDVASAVQVALGYVSAYTGATKTVTLAADPAIFTMAATDNISLFPPANVVAVAGSVNPASRLAKTMGAVIRGTAQASGSSATLIATSAFGISGAGAADQFAGRAALFDEDATTTTLRGVAVSISASTASATPVLTVGTMPATPQNGDTFSVI